MSLATLPDTITAAIKARFPGLKQCEKHDGRFDLTELERFLTVAPAVRVAVLSIGGAVEEGEGLAQGNVRLAAFVVARDAGNVKKGDAALAIVDGLVALVAGNDWGLSTAGPAKDVRAENLYSTSIGKQGVALWAVTWVQPAEMGTLAAEDGTVPTNIYASMAPDIGLAHKGDYRDVATGEAPDDA